MVMIYQLIFQNGIEVRLLKNKSSNLKTLRRIESSQLKQKEVQMRSDLPVFQRSRGGVFQQGQAVQGVWRSRQGEEGDRGQISPGAAGEGQEEVSGG